MKRIQIYLDEAVDEALTVEARRQRVSKASLIRSYVSARVTLPTETDSIDDVIGLVAGEPGDSASVNDIVYR